MQRMCSQLIGELNKKGTMTRPRSAKIYIKIKGNFCDFMWANVGPDSSVMIGFQGNGAEKLNFILDSNLWRVEVSDIQIHESLGRPKVTFHESGNYKLSTSVGLNPQSIDRCTIIGTPLSEIREPRRMMEILIPKSLKATESKILDQDIVLDASQFPQRPLRCTVSCMSYEHFYRIMESKTFFVETSDCELTQALDNGISIWAWTLRVSHEDKMAPDHFHYFLPGEIRWGKEYSDTIWTCI
jgi:hypothetical protein